jgi:RNA polymerase sigma factor (TIGR02999 family)
MPAEHEVTRLLDAWGRGSAEALDELIPLVFDDLHRMARYFFGREPEDHTLQPTALISELYLRLRGKRNTSWTCREDFFHFAAELMRHILVDAARSRLAKKRGQGKAHLPLDSAHDLTVETDLDLVALDRALEELAEVAPRQSEVVALRFFVGLEVREVAAVLDIAPATVKRDWRTAKFFLHRRIRGSDPGGPETH